MLFLLIASALVYQNRVRLINQTLAYLVAPFEVRVGDLDVFPFGQIRISDLTLIPKDGAENSALATVSETLITYKITELRKTKRFDSLFLHGVQLTLDQQNLDTLTAIPPTLADDTGNSTASTDLSPHDQEMGAVEPFLLSRLAVFTGEVQVQSGIFIVDLDSMPRIAGEWELQCDAFDPEASQPTRFSWTLRHLMIGKEGSGGNLELVTGFGSIAPDLSHLDIGPLRIEQVDLHITPNWIALSHPNQGEKDANPPSDQSSQQDKAINSPLPAPEKTGLSFYLHDIEIADGQISLSGFDGDQGRPHLPDLAFSISANFPNISNKGGQWESDGPIPLTISQVEASSGGTPFFMASNVNIGISSLGDLLTKQQIESIALREIELYASDASLACFFHPPDSSPKEFPEGRAWHIGTVDIGESALRMDQFNLFGQAMPELTASFSGTLHDLRIGGREGFSSPAEQSLELRQVEIMGPGSESTAEPLVSIKKAELIGSVDAILRDHILTKLAIEAPRISLTDSALGKWKAVTAPPVTEDSTVKSENSNLKTEPKSKTDQEKSVPAIYTITDLSISDGKLLIDTDLGGNMPRVLADFSVETRPPKDGVTDAYRLYLSDFLAESRASSSEGRKAPVAEIIRVEKMHVDVSATELQRDKHIGKIHLDGALLTVGDGLKSTFVDEQAPTPTSEDTQPTPSSSPPPSPSPLAQEDEGTSDKSDTTDESDTSAAPATPVRTLSGGWTIGEIEVSRSRVHFESLIPQVEGLQFAIETKLEDVPLTAKGLLSQKALQKVELAGVEIKDPYDSFITVAELPTIFVQFSLAGLARQEIERIELISPSLYVGQGLFWWVDYQRKFREQNEGARIRFEGETEKQSDWAIKTIEAFAGKIIIAPEGIPLGAVPFPFHATTNMEKGDIELKLNIPDEEHVYRFQDYEVELKRLVGDVQFNVPVKTEDNNLVQNFKLGHARWKEYEAEDLYLSLTFDEHGVYGKFGGDAYKGYVEGQFNFYLDGQSRWDAWVAGIDLDTGPVTSILVPDSFLMEGRVSLKVISEGKGTEVGETTGEFQTTTPGWFDITKLQPVLESLPPEWSQLQRSLTELGLQALKRFEYEQGTGNLHFNNRSGDLKLHFAGPQGTRELNIAVHDDPSQKKKKETADESKDAEGAKATDPLAKAPALRAIPIDSLAISDKRRPILQRLRKTLNGTRSIHLPQP